MTNHSARDRWPSAARIIEFGARDGMLGEHLVAAGFRYLGVVDSGSHAARLASRHPRLDKRLAVSRATKRVRQNNADVLLLRGGAAAKLRRFRDVRHAKFIACPLRNGPLTLWTMLFWAAQFLLGRLAWPRIVNVGKTRPISFRVRRPRPFNATRRFIPHSLGIEDFFGHLRRGGMPHAVLRWFDELPRLAAGEDLDLFVDDCSLAAVRELVESGPGIQAVDLYSVCGAPGADYQKLPYYPPYLAEQIVGQAIVLRDLCSVPSPRDHFLSLAYHAVYHKGAASGLPVGRDKKAAVAQADHDYAAILEELAQRLNIVVPMALADLDAYLDSQGWRPPHDMLVRLARKNKWLRKLVHQAADDPRDAGLAVFLLRREALGRGGVKRATKLIVEHGFQIVETIAIEPPRSETVARSLRGGNWAKGPWAMSGGEPVAAIVAFDPAPIRPSRRERKSFPWLANARLLKKDAIRDAFNSNRPASEHCNVIHSSDNGREARDYLRIVAPARVDEIIARLPNAIERLARAA